MEAEGHRAEAGKNNLEAGGTGDQQRQSPEMSSEAKKNDKIFLEIKDCYAKQFLLYSNL